MCRESKKISLLPLSVFSFLPPNRLLFGPPYRLTFPALPLPAENKRVCSLQIEKKNIVCLYHFCQNDSLTLIFPYRPIAERHNSVAPHPPIEGKSISNANFTQSKKSYEIFLKTSSGLNSRGKANDSFSYLLNMYRK